MPDLKLSEIWIHPIKSLGGIKLSSAFVMRKGLQYDRRWMLVDETGKFMTQRIFPAMALFKVSIDDVHLTVTHRDHYLKIDIGAHEKLEPLKVTIWNDTVIAYEVATGYSQWFSDLLGVRCKLVFFPEEHARPVDPVYKVNDEHVSLADAYPFLIIGQSSLNDLNNRLHEAVPINRFRPNFVFTGGEAYAEDTWRNFKIGDLRFVGVKLCARCILTTVNQDTGEKGTEPLKTLATYRKQENRILFGQNLVALDQGLIKIGDSIQLK